MIDELGGIVLTIDDGELVARHPDGTVLASDLGWVEVLQDRAEAEICRADVLANQLRQLGVEPAA